jgi:transposase
MPTSTLATDNQLMSNYISSPHPDLPNQYNIVIAGDDDEEEDDEDDVISQTLNSPRPHTMDVDIHHPSSMNEQSLNDQSLNDQAMGAAPYRSYTVQFKLNALDWYYKNGENKNLTAKMFNVDRKRIRDWLLDERNLRCDPTPQRTKRKRANSLPQYKDIEDALYKFYLAQREKGIRPKNAELRAKSLEFASLLGYRETFKASIHWLCNWKRRNKISFAVPDHLIQNTTEEEEDSGSATPPFAEERLGRAQSAQMYKAGRASGGNYDSATGVDGIQNTGGGNGVIGYGQQNTGGGGGVAYVQSVASGSGSAGYVVNSVSSRNSPVSIVGRTAASDGLVSRSSNGAGIGRAYGGEGSGLAMSRSTSGSSGNVGGVAYGGVGLDGLRNVVGVDGVAERMREASHHIHEQPVSGCD